MEASSGDPETIALAREVTRRAYALQSSNLTLLSEIKVIQERADATIERERLAAQKDLEELQVVFRKFLASARDETYKELTGLHAQGIRMYESQAEREAVQQQAPGRGQAEAAHGSDQHKIERLDHRNQMLSNNLVSLQHYNAQLWSELKLSRATVESLQSSVLALKTRAADADLARSSLETAAQTIADFQAWKVGAEGRIAELEAALDSSVHGVRADLGEADHEVGSPRKTYSDGNAAEDPRASVSPVKFRALDETASVQLLSPQTTPERKGGEDSPGHAREDPAVNGTGLLPPPPYTPPTVSPSHRPFTAASGPRELSPERLTSLSARVQEASINSLELARYLLRSAHKAQRPGNLTSMTDRIADYPDYKALHPHHGLSSVVNSKGGSRPTSSQQDHRPSTAPGGSLSLHDNPYLRGPSNFGATSPSPRNSPSAKAKANGGSPSSSSGGKPYIRNGWVKKVDFGGRLYYYNKMTGVSQWTNPH